MDKDSDEDIQFQQPLDLGNDHLGTNLDLVAEAEDDSNFSEFQRITTVAAIKLLIFTGYLLATFKTKNPLFNKDS